MYYLRCSYNPDGDQNEYFNPNVRYDDSFLNEYCNKLEILDRFIYLLDMFKIIEDATTKIEQMTFSDDDNYWKISKCLLDYVNTIFSYKEYVRSFMPLKRNGNYKMDNRVNDKYYKEENWYRFICEYRNRVIHHGTRINDYSLKKNEFYIIVDSLRKELTDPKIDDKSKNCLTELIKIIDNHPGCCVTISDENHLEKSCLGIKRISAMVLEEINTMKDDILFNAYKFNVLPALEWILSKIYTSERGYSFTLIIDENQPDKVWYEPNNIVEEFFKDMKNMLGNNHAICRNIKILFQKKDYSHFYND